MELRPLIAVMYAGTTQSLNGLACDLLESTVRMEMSKQIDDQDQWSALKYN